jgi:hypothetical protein
LEDRTVPSFAEFVDPHPAAGNQFGAAVVPLSTGNVVVTSPFDDAGGTDAGAVYLFSGATGALIRTITGSIVGDQVGGGGVTALVNGNFVIASPDWSNGGTSSVGAVTWGSGTAGIAGTVSSANSLVGSSASDQIGSGRVTALTNGNYVVASPLWDNSTHADAGAATWGSGTAGLSGTVSTANSIVGAGPGNNVGGGGVTALTNGNYVVSSPLWDQDLNHTDLGAVTWADGATAEHFPVSFQNSLVGHLSGDEVGSGGVTALPNGNYVVSSPLWDSSSTVADVGAATWGDGTTGVQGPISLVNNSLVGGHAGDEVGSGGVTALTNGNYVVSSPLWDNGNAADVGAATWGDGTTGVKGGISNSNSLLGNRSGDEASSGGVTALTNGNYVVGSPLWDFSGNSVNVGAATWGDGATG